MKKYRINCKKITSWDSFHNVFAETFDFPDYYGRNMDAWNDSMSDRCDSNGGVSLHLDNAHFLKKENAEIFAALVECTGFINWRATDDGEEPLMTLSFFV